MIVAVRVEYTTTTTIVDSDRLPYLKVVIPPGDDWALVGAPVVIATANPAGWYRFFWTWTRSVTVVKPPTDRITLPKKD